MLNDTGIDATAMEADGIFTVNSRYHLHKNKSHFVFHPKYSILMGKGVLQFT